MYGIDGRTELPERTLEHLEGDQGCAPVRVGNAAVDQLQLTYSPGSGNVEQTLNVEQML